VYKKVLKAFI